MARTFVLVHGGWCGAWVWRDLLSGLRKLGHNASAPTLTGLGERRRRGVATADLGTHIEDVVAHISMEDLREVTLVGWSYGGAVTTGTCDRVPDRIQSMIYLDAFMPANGKAVIDYNPRARMQVESAVVRDEPIPPPPLKYFGVTEPKLIGFIEPRLSAQPWRTFKQPIQLVGPQSPVPFTYIACTCWGDTPFTERLAEVGKQGSGQPLLPPITSACSVRRMKPSKRWSLHKCRRRIVLGTNLNEFNNKRMPRRSLID